MDENRVMGTMKNVAGKVEGGAGDLTGDKKTQVEGRLREAEGAAQHMLGQATEVVRDVAGDASTALSDAFEAGAHYYQEGSRAVGRRVEDNALAALLVAGAAGYALAWLVHGRR